MFDKDKQTNNRESLLTNKQWQTNDTANIVD